MRVLGVAVVVILPVLIGTAFADVPPAVFPVLAPADVQAQWATSHADALACDPVWPDAVVVCFRVQEGKKRRFVTSRDLAAWGVDVAAVRAAVTERARPALATQPVRRTVDGTDKSYFAAAEGDGWSAATLLAPEVVAGRLGAPFLVAAPTDGAVLVWLPGDGDLDKIMAVGAKQMYDAAEWPVSAVVYQWDGARFRPFVEAVPAPSPVP